MSVPILTDHQPTSKGMNLLYYVLSAKLYISNAYNSVLDSIFKIKEINIIDDGKKKSVMIKYLMYCYCNYIIYWLIKMRNIFDIKNDIIHFTKKTNNCKKVCILSKKNIDFDYVNTKICNIDDNLNMGNVIYRKFHIYDDKNDVCFKDYLIKYRDYNKCFDNTVENILLFNNINIIGNPPVNIIFRNNLQSTNITLPYENIRAMHISDFDDLKQ